MKIQVGTLCFTCGSRIPANNNLLVMVVEIDHGLAPNSYRIRRVTGEHFYSTTLPTGVRRWQHDAEAWTARSRLRPVDPDGLLDQERQQHCLSA